MTVRRNTFAFYRKIKLSIFFYPGKYAFFVSLRPDDFVFFYLRPWFGHVLSIQTRLSVAGAVGSVTFDFKNLHCEKSRKNYPQVRGPHRTARDAAGGRHDTLPVYMLRITARHVVPSDRPPVGRPVRMRCNLHPRPIADNGVYGYHYIILYYVLVRTGSRRSQISEPYYVIVVRQTLALRPI